MDHSYSYHRSKLTVRAWSPLLLPVDGQPTVVSNSEGVSRPLPLLVHTSEQEGACGEESGNVAVTGVLVRVYVYRVGHSLRVPGVPDTSHACDVLVHVCVLLCVCVIVRGVTAGAPIVSSCHDRSVPLRRPSACVSIESVYRAYASAPTLKLDWC